VKSWSGQRKKENEEKDGEVVEEDEGPNVQYGFGRIMQNYNQVAGYLSILVAIINAVTMPAFGFLLSNLMFVIIEGPDSPTFAENRDYWILFGVFIMLGSATVGFMQKLIFSYSGEAMTLKVRKDLFREIMYKNVSWFDRKSKAPGILSVVFSEDITNLNGLSTETIGALCETFFCIIVGVSVSALFEWRMSLVCLAATPMVMLGGVLMAKLQWKSGKAGRGEAVEKVEDPYDKSNALLSDVITNYRTVISFGQENIDGIMTKYQDLLVGPLNLRIMNAHLAGIAYGYSVCIRFVYVGIVFYVGAKFTVDYNLSSKDVFLSIYIIFTSALGAGFAMSAVPSATEARESARTVFNMIDEKSTIDVRNSSGGIKKVEKGTIEFKNITFNYPSRKKKVLSNFNMVIPAGKKIGLVGHSGCGKSTITNLLLRFYDIKQGDVLIDGKNINEYDIAELRKQIGYVMQEPVLFNATIKENILFGKLDA